MNGVGSSPSALRSWRDAWRDFYLFLRDPTLPGRQIAFGREARAELIRLFALDAIAMTMIVVGFVAASALGTDLPKTTLLDGRSTSSLIVGAVLLAPLIEEMFFRSWLSARKIYLTAGMTLIGLVAMLIGARLSLGPLSHLQFGFLAIGWLVATIWLLVPRWRDQTLFAPVVRHFAKLFWTSSALFGLAHLVNYNDEVSALLILMVVPQFVLGTILGYARVTLGLWASITLHAMHNGLAVGLILALG